MNISGVYASLPQPLHAVFIERVWQLILDSYIRDRYFDETDDSGRNRYTFTSTGRSVFLQERAGLLSLFEQGYSAHQNPGSPDERSPASAPPGAARSPATQARTPETPGIQHSAPRTGPSPISDDLLRELSLFMLLPESTREHHRQSLVLLGAEDDCRMLIRQARTAVSALYGEDKKPLNVACNERVFPRSQQEYRKVVADDEQVGAAHPDLVINVWTRTGLLEARRRPQGLNAQEQNVLTDMQIGSSLRSRQIFVGGSFDLRRETRAHRSYLCGRVKILALWPHSWAGHDQQLDAFWQAGGPLSSDPEEQLKAYKHLGEMPILRHRAYQPEALTSRLDLFLSECRYHENDRA